MTTSNQPALKQRETKHNIEVDFLTALLADIDEIHGKKYKDFEKLSQITVELNQKRYKENESQRPSWRAYQIHKKIEREI